VDNLRAVLYRESCALLLNAGWLRSLIQRQPAAAVAPDQSISGWDVARLQWSLERLNDGTGNLRALAAQAAMLQAFRCSAPSRTTTVAIDLPCIISAQRVRSPLR
jgi:hypothetical protein